MHSIPFYLIINSHNDHIKENTSNIIFSVHIWCPKMPPDEALKCYTFYRNFMQFKDYIMYSISLTTCTIDHV